MAIRETSAGHEALGLDEDDLRRMHYHMLIARRVDERSWILNRQGKAAFVISCQGQEAAQVGAAYNLRPGGDYLYPYYRDSGMTLLLGQSPVTSSSASSARRKTRTVADARCQATSAAGSSTS